MNALHSLNSQLRGVFSRLSPGLRWAVVVVSIVVVLINVVTLILFATHGSEAARFITGGSHEKFYSELDADLTDDYAEVFGIAHNSGNSIDDINEALAYGADIIEVDVVRVKGVLRSAHWSPLSFLGMGLFRGPKLEQVWGAAAQADVIKLDLKNASDAMVDDLIEFLSERHRAKNEVLAVTGDLEILTRLYEQDAKVLRMLGVKDSSTLNSLSNDEEMLKVVEGVAVRHDLLTADIVKTLKDKGLKIDAWTVEDPETMNELVEYGVDAITTDNLAILQLLGGDQRGEAEL